LTDNKLLGTAANQIKYISTELSQGVGMAW